MYRRGYHSSFSSEAHETYVKTPTVRQDSSTGTFEEKENETWHNRTSSASKSIAVPGDEQDSALLSEELEKKSINDGEDSYRVSNFHDAAVNLSVASNTISNRLDDSYYSILDKLSTLQSTVNSLKKLAIMTRELNIDFVAEGEDLIHAANAQLDSFNNFEDQAIHIKQLKERVESGRERMGILRERVKEVKMRVEGWEKREREQQDQTRKRLRILWGCLSGILVLVFMVRIVPLWMANSSNLEHSKQVANINEEPDSQIFSITSMEQDSNEPPIDRLNDAKLTYSELDNNEKLTNRKDL
ncbi:Bgt-4217 [Blumeria graminis f. sp. tritici]|uniref:Bgt-4217 n=2 Tax=Blumeria graminis f. sp. tritici TaxID=62690 RepID=A0A061HJ99_BLUGR|nr:hypothetical protein BGT96224_4217 [Blumeria graminis f. sp. tritici 96224]VDB93631.1 Bgt-4217 [Blumeria graminis f. sp. tritici]